MCWNNVNLMVGGRVDVESVLELDPKDLLGAVGGHGSDVRCSVTIIRAVEHVEI